MDSFCTSFTRMFSMIEGAEGLKDNAPRNLAVSKFVI